MMSRNERTVRYGAALLAAALVLAVPAMATFTEGENEAPGSAPIAREIEVRTYRNIPYRAKFLVRTTDGGEVTYQVERQPKKGTVSVSGDTFTYTPMENKTGKDSFTYVAVDAEGRTSAPAEVRVTIRKAKSGVNYADTADSSAAAAAQYLAEAGVFTGAQLGGQYFFEPERPVSRSEFLALTLETAGRDATEVEITGFCDDAAIPTWAKSYAAAALSDGIVQGTATGEGAAFRGNDPITFNEAASILDRVLSVNDVDLAVWYADRAAVPSWAAQAVGNMESVSVLQAGSFGSAGLNEGITRADMACMLEAAAVLLEGEPDGFLDWLN